MIKIDEVIIVEGKYDKQRVANAVEATVIETKGFGVFADREKADLIRRLSEKRGVIILTDSDSGGFLIRNHLKGILQNCNVKHAYIPDIYGKEKRKTSLSKEGKLGVEGMDKAVIIDALIKSGAGITECTGASAKGGITKTDMYRAGLSGGSGSRNKRKKLMKRLDLPENLSANALLDVLNVLYSKDEFLSVAADDND